MPPMSLGLLKAMTPPTLDGYDLVPRCWDEVCMGGYDVAKRAPDLLCLSSLTTSAARAYHIAGEARDVSGVGGKPIQIAMGGIHATALPREALAHVDAVALGETAPSTLRGMLSWLIAQRPAGGAEKRAFEMRPDAAAEPRPLPDWSWAPAKGYLAPWSMQTSVGCPFDCSFCSVTFVYGSHHRALPYEEIEQEAARFGRKGTGVVIDDNFLPNKLGEHAKRVCEMFQRHKVKWVTELTALTLYNNAKELIPLFARSGCRGLYLGIESISGSLSKSMDTRRYTDLVKRCHDYGIGVLGAFVFGVGPEETPDTFERTAEWGIQAKLDLAQFSINTPEPGARDFESAVRGGLITDWNWEHYDGAHPVRRFEHISQEAMYQGLRNAFEWFYSARGAWRRLSPDLLETARWTYWRRSLFMAAVNKYLSGTQKLWHAASVYDRFLADRVEEPNRHVLEQFAPGMPEGQYDARARNKVLQKLAPNPLHQVIPDIAVASL
jgi:radical SAM superfamily enzyme YgiQ (UPF0313 family)